MNKPKFRAWDRETSEMIENPTVLEIWQGKPINEQFALEAEEKLIWMQYTGLKDKNGVEIYEGDICEWHIPDMSRPEPDAMIRYVSVVEYRKGSFNLSGYLLPNVRLIKVLGSIHENPELLSGVSD